MEGSLCLILSHSVCAHSLGQCGEQQCKLQPSLQKHLKLDCLWMLNVTIENSLEVLCGSCFKKFYVK
jgi:hypothetical protein